MRMKRGKPATERKNIIDRVVSYFAPGAAVKRARQRVALELFGSYDGASISKRSLSQWSTFGYDADTDILSDLPKLRERSRDLVRNNPLACGAIKTKVTSVIGTGLRLQARIDREFLGLTDEQAEAWETGIEREWRLFWGSHDCDATRTLNGYGLTRLVYQQAKENGDVFVMLPRIQRPLAPYELALQVIEADRVSNRDGAMDTETLAGGVQRDENGAPIKYHILKHHPGSNKAFQTASEWIEVSAFGANTGLPNILHLYAPTRPGQSRGVPDLAPVIEIFKQLGRYTEAEVMAAVVSGMFTVFIESDIGAGGFDYTKLGAETGASDADKDYKLGNGLIMELARGEKVHDSNPGRPNTAFDGFVQALLRQIGVALEMPYEILIKHFTASYSAARAALLTFWQYVISERQWLEDNFLRRVYEVWMWEAVSSGRVAAPGYFADPAIRAAYLGAYFIGPAKGQIDETKEVEAATMRINAGLSTLAQETAELTGGDWERNHVQQVKENKKRTEDGLVTPDAPERREDKDDERD